MSHVAGVLAITSRRENTVALGLPAMPLAEAKAVKRVSAEVLLFVGFLVCLFYAGRESYRIRLYAIKTCARASTLSE